MTDVQIRNEGNLFLFSLLTDKARAWVDAHIEDQVLFGDALVVEHRYAWDLAQGMLSDGLTVE